MTPPKIDGRKALIDFLDFIRAQGVVGLAIGFVLGGAVAKVVAAIVSDLVAPLIGLILGSAKGLEEIVLGPFKIGNLISVCIDSLAVALVVYLAVKWLGLDKLDKRGGEGHGAEAAKDELKDVMKEQGSAAKEGGREASKEG